MQEAESFKIVLNMERREDGGLRVWSDDVPGLVLSHKDPQKVLDDIKPALEFILSEVFGCVVEIRRLGALPVGIGGSLPRKPRQRRVESQIYDRPILEYAAAPCH